MTFRGSSRLFWPMGIVSLLALGAAGASAAQSKPDTSRVALPPSNLRYIGTVPDTGQFLPDSVVMLRVDDRVITVKDFIATYFDSYAEFRPRPDSAGRLEFLNTLTNREVMSLVANEANPKLGFEERAVMRAHTERALANVLYQRAVLDSVVIDEREVVRIYEQFKYAQHLQHILVEDRATAQRVREDLVRKRIKWADAQRKYSIAKGDPGPEGGLGWIGRLSLPLETANAVFGLAEGEISQPYEDVEGWHIVRAVGRRPVSHPSFQSMRRVIEDQISGAQSAILAERLNSQLRARAELTFNHENIAWAASHFKETTTIEHGKEVTNLTINTEVPRFSSADTGRVLATFNRGRISLIQFVHSYREQPALARPVVNTPPRLQAQVENMALEPYRAELALQRGLDRDPLTQKLIGARRDALLAERLYQDSILARIVIDPKERRKYYDEHLSQYMTFPKVRFASFVAENKGRADSIVARLKAGEKPQDMLRADSLVGRKRGSIKVMSQNDEGMPFHTLVFQELRPGQINVDGPDEEGEYIIVQLLSFDSGSQLPYEDVEHLVDESVRNITAQKLLDQFLERHRRGRRIESHPELVMRVRLVDPAL